MVIVEGFVRMQNAGDFETVRAAAEAQIAASRAESGCIDSPMLLMSLIRRSCVFWSAGKVGMR